MMDFGALMQGTPVGGMEATQGMRGVVQPGDKRLGPKKLSLQEHQELIQQAKQKKALEMLQMMAMMAMMQQSQMQPQTGMQGQPQVGMQDQPQGGSGQAQSQSVGMGGLMPQGGM